MNTKLSNCENAWISSYAEILRKMEEENRYRKYWAPIENVLNDYFKLNPKNSRSYNKAYSAIHKYLIKESRSFKKANGNPIAIHIYRNMTIFLENYLIKLQQKSKNVPQDGFLVFYLKERDLFDSLKNKTLNLFIFQEKRPLHNHSFNNSHIYDFSQLFRIQWQDIFYENIRLRLDALIMCEEDEKLNDFI